MRYTTKQYATSLLASLEKKSQKEQGEISKRFISLLQKNGDYTRRHQIIKEVERIYLRGKGVSKIEVELASETSASLAKDIEKALNRKIIFSARKNMDILGGIKILIDEETLIDASARTQVAKIFQK